LKTVLAVIGGLWVVGRLSRRSANHPANLIPDLLGRDPQQPYPVDGPQQETAQIQGSIILGEGGGE
jgi:hypothetical protein